MSVERIKKWNDGHAVFLLLAAVLAFGVGQLALLAVAAFISFLFYIYQMKAVLKNYQPYGGYANWVTAFRLLLLLALGFCYQWLSAVELTALLLGVVLLDVVDGYLARKTNQQSDFGLYFDMETDAFYVALVSSILYLQELAPAWLLLVGYMRYLNVAVYQLLRLKPKKEAKQRFASTIAGALFIVLAISFVLPSTFRYYSLLIVSILVLLSFGVSFWNYFKTEK